MSRYEYNKGNVDQGLSYLRKAQEKINQSSSPINKGLDNLSATGIDAYLNDYSKTKSNLLSLYDTCNEYVNHLYSAVESKSKEIDEFNNKPWWEKLFASIGMGLLKFGEGLLSVGEGIIDGCITLVGFVAGGVAGVGSLIFDSSHDFKKGFNEVGNKFGEVVKKDVVGDAFASAYAEGGILNGLEKSSYFSSQSTAANIIKGAGAITGYVLIGAATGGVAGGAIANGILTGLATTGQSTQRNLIKQGDNMDFLAAGGEGIVEGVVAGTLAYGASKSSEALKSAKAEKAATKEAIKLEKEAAKEATEIAKNGKHAMTKAEEKAAQELAKNGKHAAETTSLIDKGKNVAEKGKDFVVEKATNIANKATNDTAKILQVEKIGGSKLATTLEATKAANVVTKVANAHPVAISRVATAGRLYEGLTTSSTSGEAIAAKEDFATINLQGVTADETMQFQNKNQIVGVDASGNYSDPAVVTQTANQTSDANTTPIVQDTATPIPTHNTGGGGTLTPNNNYSTLSDYSTTQARMAETAPNYIPTQSVSEISSPSTPSNSTTPSSGGTTYNGNSSSSGGSNSSIGGNSSSGGNQSSSGSPSSGGTPSSGGSSSNGGNSGNNFSNSSDNGVGSSTTSIGSSGTSHSGGGYSSSGYSFGGSDVATGDTTSIDSSELTEVGESTSSIGTLASSVSSTFKNKTIKIPTTSETIETSSKTNIAIPTAAALSAAAAAGIGTKAYLERRENSNNNEDEEFEEGEENNGFYSDEWEGTEDDIKIDYGTEENQALDDDDDDKYSADSIIEKYEAVNSSELEEVK